MADEVKLTSCKICKNALASSVKTCIHCGANDPIPKKPESVLLFFIISAVLLLVIWLAALEPGCIICEPLP